MGCIRGVFHKESEASDVRDISRYGFDVVKMGLTYQTAAFDLSKIIWDLLWEVEGPC